MIRLARFGKNKKPIYRFIVSEKSRDTKGTYLESLGWYNPSAQSANLEINAERVKYWVGHGAQLSATVNNLLIEKKVIKGEKRKTVKISGKKRAAKEKAAEAKKE